MDTVPHIRYLVSGVRFPKMKKIKKIIFVLRTSEIKLCVIFRQRLACYA